jgi:hypothetical protein
VIILVSQGTVSSVDLEASLELLRAEEVALAAIEYPSLGKQGLIMSPSARLTALDFGLKWPSLKA